MTAIQLRPQFEIVRTEAGHLMATGPLAEVRAWRDAQIVRDPSRQVINGAIIDRQRGIVQSIVGVPAPIEPVAPAKWWHDHRKVGFVMLAATPLVLAIGYLCIALAHLVASIAHLVIGLGIVAGVAAGLLVLLTKVTGGKGCEGVHLKH